MEWNEYGEERWELITARVATQRAVLDREALDRSVEEVMVEAAQ